MAAGYLKFKIGDACGVIPADRVREVLPMADLNRPPRRPAALEGFLNLGGRMTPVIRLDRALGLPDVAVNAESHLILLRNEPLAVLVERALAYLGTGEAVVAAAPGGYRARHVRVGSETFFVLDVDQVRRDLDRATDAGPDRVVTPGRSDDAA